MELATIRKAITAAVLAALLSLATAIIEGRAPHDVGGWVGLVMLSLASGVVAGVAVYKVTNAGSINGSYPPDAHPFGPTTRNPGQTRRVTGTTFRPGRSSGGPAQMDPSYDPPSGSMNPPKEN